MMGSARHRSAVNNQGCFRIVGLRTPECQAARNPAICFYLLLASYWPNRRQFGRRTHAPMKSALSRSSSILLALSASLLAAPLVAEDVSPAASVPGMHQR